MVLRAISSWLFILIWGKCPLVTPHPGTGVTGDLWLLWFILCCMVLTWCDDGLGMYTDVHRFWGPAFRINHLYCFYETLNKMCLTTDYRPVRPGFRTSQLPLLYQTEPRLLVLVLLKEHELQITWFLTPSTCSEVRVTGSYWAYDFRQKAKNHDIYPTS